MAWAKSKPMTWEVFQDFCSPGETATVYQKLVNAKQKVVDVVALPDGSIMILSLKGTPIKKAKEVSDEDQ